MRASRTTTLLSCVAYAALLGLPIAQARAQAEDAEEGEADEADEAGGEAPSDGSNYVRLSEAETPPPSAEPEDRAPPPPTGAALDPDSYVALSADEEAQSSLGGFRRYLERTRAADEGLYRVLDVRLDDLESRELAADVIFWTATGLALATLVAAIPVHELVDQEAGLGMIFAGAGTFLLGAIIQAIVRPGRGDLVSLIDLHDQRLGRR